MMKLGSGAVTTMVGGMVSEATGGKFQDGALTAMTIYLYNEIDLKSLEYTEDMVARQQSAEENRYQREMIKSQELICTDELFIPAGRAINSGIKLASKALGSAISKISSATGELKHWIRLSGDSYSKGMKLRTKAIRSGTNKHYSKQIGNEKLRALNLKLRDVKLPTKSWRTMDPGHFHLWKLK